MHHIDNLGEGHAKKIEGPERTQNIQKLLGLNIYENSPPVDGESCMETKA